MMRRAAVLALAALAVAPAARAASGQPVFGLRAVDTGTRGYFVYSLAPGGSTGGTVIVSNAGSATGTVKLFTADATTGRTSGTVYETDRRAARAGSWIELSATSLTLAPGEHQDVPFSVHVPTGQAPGEWVGGIVAEPSQRPTGKKGGQKANVQIKIRDLTIVAVQTNVPGPPVVSLKIGPVTAGGRNGFQQLFVHFENAGNLLLKPSGSVRIFDATGAAVETLRFTMDTFLPKTSIDYPLLLRKALGPGDYDAAVTLAANGRSFTARPAFAVSKQSVRQVFTSAAPTRPAASGESTPWTLIAVAAAAIAAALLLAVALLRRPSGRTGAAPH
jgi:hypothetical protein